MARTNTWIRGNSYNGAPAVGAPIVVQLASFDAGDTLMRTRIDLQFTGATETFGSPFPTQWSQFQVVVALLWDQAPGGPEAPPGYFDTALFPWIWAQQVTWQTDCITTVVEGNPTSTSFINTAESRSIDCHSERLTSPDNLGALWLVADIQYVADAAGVQINDLSFGYSVLVKNA